MVYSYHSIIVTIADGQGTYDLIPTFYVRSSKINAYEGQRFINVALCGLLGEVSHG